MYTLTQSTIKMTFDKKFTPPPRMKPAERKYFNSLKLIAKEIERILKSSLSSVSTKSGIAAIDLLEGYSKSIENWAAHTVSSMLHGVDKDNRKSWEKQAAKMSSELRKELLKPVQKEWMQEYMDDNIRLIKSMPLKAAKSVHKLVKENQAKGLRSDELIEEIMRIGNVQENRARLIARTETSRYSTALTKMRATSIGSDWYVWKSVGDFRTRQSHRKMKGILVNWNDPPSPERLFGEKAYGEYHAGETFNCRCYPQAIVDVDNVTFPAKVYREGKIETMKKDQFINMVGRMRH